MNSRRKFKIVLTGGPSAGKTSILKILEKNFIDEVKVVPETATILYSGGFPRTPSLIGKKLCQKAIYHVQCSLEELYRNEYPNFHLLCDRGTLDGLAYWPESQETFFQQHHTTMTQELTRYDFVIQLDTTERLTYDALNPIRPETFQEALRINERLHQIWSNHPNYYRISAQKDFFRKVRITEALVRHLLFSEKNKQQYEIKRIQRFLKS